MEGEADSRTTEAVLHGARALVLADLTARGVAEAEIVSLLEDALSKRRWWLEQWADGAALRAGLLAQDVQDALMETLRPLAAVPVVRRAARADRRARARRRPALGVRGPRRDRRPGRVAARPAR